MGGKLVKEVFPFSTIEYHAPEVVREGRLCNVYSDIYLSHQQVASKSDFEVLDFRQPVLE